MNPKKQYEPPERKRLVAASPFSNAPMVLDDDTEQIRPGTIRDVIKMYQLAETSSLYESVNPGIVDPVDNDIEDQYLAQIAMLLKYSDKYPSFGFRATRSNTKGGDIYSSVKKAISMVQEIKENDKTPVLAQGICPLSPLAYDEECLLNLIAFVEEKQEVSFYPCTLGFMTGPESLMGILIHDLAICLAGAVYVQLLKPGTSVSFSYFSTMSDMRTMQPVYACPEYLYLQVMFYEVCLHYHLDAVFCGCFADGVRNDYQAGYESCLTAIAPFSMTEIDEMWCYPGHMSAFAGASFIKMIFDEELLINCNRILQGPNLSIDPLLKDKLEKSIETKSFLTLGDPKIYRTENRLSKVLDKKGLGSGMNSSENPTHLMAKTEIEKRCAEYTLPKRSDPQKKLLQEYLPTGAKY